MVRQTRFTLTTDAWGQINIALIVQYWDKVVSIVPDDTTLMCLQCGYIARVFQGGGLDVYANQSITGTINYYI